MKRASDQSAAKSKPTSGPTVSEDDRRERGQSKILLRLSESETADLARKALDGETRQATIRRAIHELPAKQGKKKKDRKS